MGRLFGLAARRAHAARARAARARRPRRAPATWPLRKYSKGMLQRLGIAQALINDPELVVLDEPMTGLDPIGRKEIRDLIVELKREGKTVLFSTHILSDVELICDRVAIVVGGRMRDVGPLEQLLSPRLIAHRGRRSRRTASPRRSACRPTPTSTPALREALAAGKQDRRRHAAPRVARGSVRARGRRRPTSAAAPSASSPRRGGELMSRVWALALNTFREAVRNKVLYMLLLFALVLFASTYFFGQGSLHEELRVTRDVGLVGIELFGALIAIFVGVNLVYKELDRKTVFALIPKPIHRWEFVLGKYARHAADAGGADRRSWR